MIDDEKHRREATSAAELHSHTVDDDDVDGRERDGADGDEDCDACVVADGIGAAAKPRARREQWARRAQQTLDGVFSEPTPRARHARRGGGDGGVGWR
jgi:hypothetical protein